MFMDYTHKADPSWWFHLNEVQLHPRFARLAPTATGRPEASLPHVHVPFAFTTNIQADHCFGAFGFLTGMRIPGNEFQGDFCSANMCASSLQSKETIVTFALRGDASRRHKLTAADLQVLI